MLSHNLNGLVNLISKSPSPFTASLSQNRTQTQPLMNISGRSIGWARNLKPGSLRRH